MAHLDGDSAVAPFLDQLDASGIAAIHDASMEIVESIGIQLNHERARAVFESHGATVNDEHVVTVPREVVERAVEHAPQSFTLHARDPSKSVEVGGDHTPIRAPGYGASHVRTTDGRHRSTLADYETLVKLAHAEDVITCTGYQVCEPADSDPGRRHLDMLERSLVLSDQPVMGATYGAERAQASIDMVAIALGQTTLDEPAVAGLINTVPPRRIDEPTLGGLLTFADHGQPLIVSSFTMAGASGPASLASSMAQANAENLVGITLAQLVNPGTPVVYGVPSATVDGRYGSLAIGSPASALFASLAGQLGRFYGLPSRGGGALTDGKTVDYQSGFESTLVQTVTAVSDVDFVLNAAGILESYSAISPEKFVLDCETIRCLDEIREFSIDESSFDLDRVAATEPAGHYLEQPARDGTGASPTAYHATVGDKRTHDDWASDGRKSAFELGRDRVRTLLEDYEPPPMADAIERELATYVTDHAPAA